MAVYIHLPLAEGFHINKGVARLLEVEGAAIVSGLGGKRREQGNGVGNAWLEGLLSRGIVVGQGGYGPILEVDGHLVAVNLCAQCNSLGDALEVLYGASEVDSSHCLDENGESCAFVNFRQHDALLVLHAVDFADVLSVDEHLRKVVCVVHGEQGGRHGGQCGLVYH